MNQITKELGGTDDIKPNFKRQTSIQIDFGCSRNVGAPINTETDLLFTKIGLRQKIFREKTFS